MHLFMRILATMEETNVEHKDLQNTGQDSDNRVPELHKSSEMDDGPLDGADAKRKPSTTDEVEPGREAKCLKLELGGSAKEAEKPISKRQMKRMARHQRWLDLKPLRKQKEKEKLKAKKQKVKEERKRLGIDEDSIRGPKLIKMSDPEASKVTVAIDCGFDHLMNDMDIRKVAKQIQRCYAANRRAPSPFQLHLCSLNSKTKSRFEENVRGYINWDVHRHDAAVEDVFPKEKIVYLSSESENVLQELDPTKAYIIGGLVDHNHQKGLCCRLAVEKGWGHAQLPISDFVAINGRKVLTINQVFEILLGFLSSHNWKKAFYEVLPSRKVLTFNSNSTNSEDLNGSHPPGQEKSIKVTETNVSEGASHINTEECKSEL